MHEQPAFTFLASTTCAAETVNVGLTVTRNTNLDDVGNIREIHTTSSHIRGEQDTLTSLAEVVRTASAERLRETRVNLEQSHVAQRRVAEF